MFEPKTLMDEVIEVSSSGEIAVLFISEECKYYKKNLKKTDCVLDSEGNIEKLPLYHYSRHWGNRVFKLDIDKLPLFEE
jgi:hypothetical protein|tara:strand:+ start:4302 stop:4538 length:237 start_codon:yes stop_codon:yes gene_type:complete